MVTRESVVGRKILLFEEYTHEAQTGDDFHPYIYLGRWYIAGDQITLKEVCRLCKLDDTEMNMLILKYGVK